MDNSASAQTFHLFTRLPPELRDRIWFFCLPRRVVPLDNPLWENSKDSEQQCWVHDRAFVCRAKAPPFIASVCHEARQVAFYWGGLEDLDAAVSINNAWIQRKLDTVLCSWTPYHSSIAGHDADRLQPFLWLQRYNYPGAPVCLLAEHFFEFYSKASAPENEYSPCVWKEDMPDPITFLLQEAKKEEHNTNNIDVSIAMDADVVMETIYIHASKTDLLTSQLFGRIADEPCQLVDYDDTATIAKFRTLFEKNPNNQQRTAVAKLFNSIESPEFPSQVRKWLGKVEGKLLALKWLFEKQYNPQSIIYKEPIQVFNNSDAISTSSTGILWQEGINTFKFDHPWVIQETGRLPKLTPKIWFAYCTKDCRVRRKSADVEG